MGDPLWGVCFSEKGEGSLMRFTYLNLVLIVGVIGGCQAGNQSSSAERSGQNPAEEGAETAEESGSKLTDPDCSDPDLSKVVSGVEFMLCDGSIGEGTFSLADLSNLAAANIKSGIEIAGVKGTHTGDSFGNCVSGGEQGCITAGNFKAADTTSLGAKVVSGQTVAGVAGSYSPDFPDANNVRASDTVNNVSGTLADCAAGGTTGCVTVTAYKSVTISGLAANIKNSVVVAGETGTYPSAGNLLTGAGGTPDLSDNAGARDAQLKSATSFEWFLPNGTRATGSGDADIATASNIITGVNIFGTDGSAAGGTGDSFGNCVSGGEQGCITSGNFKAADITSLAAKVVSGQTVAGVAGSHSPDFPDASNVRASDTVNNASGTLADCAAGGATGCVTVTAYKSVTISGLAAKIKNSVVVAGETGTYPSAGNLLAGADGTSDFSDNAGTRDAQLKSATAFEWFLPNGTRATGAGDADIATASNIITGVNIFGTAGSAAGGASPDEWDVRYGVTVGATTGKLKMNCRNMGGAYDKTDGLAGAGLDVYDTVDDYNNGAAAFGSFNTPPFPNNNPWGSDEYFCGFNDPTDASWERVTTSPVTAGANSVYKDKLSGMNWSRGTSIAEKDWDEVAGGASNGALEYCADLDLENASAGYGGITGWRLPTQKELQTAYAHGIHDLDDGHTATNHLGDLDQKFWSSSTRSDLPSYAWYVNLNLGYTSQQFKTLGLRVLCVAP